MQKPWLPTLPKYPLTRTQKNLLGLHILRMLVMPFTDFPAYERGIIDDKGNILKPAATLWQKEDLDAYTMLDRLIIRMKRLINIVPWVKPKFTTYTQAWMLVRECYENNEEPIDLEYRFLNAGPVNSEDVQLVEDYINNKIILPFSVYAKGNR